MSSTTENVNIRIEYWMSAISATVLSGHQYISN